MSALSKQVNEKFQKTADEKKKTSSAPPRWGDVYRLGDLPKLSEIFLWLLNKPVASSRHVTLSLEDIAKLETCVRGLVESQAFCLWSIATMFEFLKDSICVPEDSLFRQLIASMTTALTSQAKATFSVVAFFPAGVEGVVCVPYSGLHPSFCEARPALDAFHFYSV